jgi:RHS repeat-associated protein
LLILLLASTPTTTFAQTETVEYYGLDAIGSVRVIFTPAGALIGRIDFGPFGEELSGAPATPKERLAGLYRDGEAGLDYAKARAYQIRTGRFGTVDPVMSALFEPQLWNRYAYALNDPIRFSDPWGLCPDCPRTAETVTVTGSPSYIELMFKMVGVGGSGGGIGTGVSGGIGQGGRTSGGGRGTQYGSEPSVFDEVIVPVVQMAVEVATEFKDRVCAAMPDGRMMSLSGGIGGLGATTGSVEIVYNHNTGEAALFTSLGAQGGWNGVLSGSLNFGLIQNLGNDNRNYSGNFTGGSVNVPYGNVGVGGGFSIGGPPYSANSVKMAAASVSASMLGRFGGGLSVSTYSGPQSAGGFVGRGARPFSVFDDMMFLARQLCK